MIRVKDFIQVIRTRKFRDWRRVGDRELVSLFKRTAAEVPAYKDFLKKHGVRPRDIRSVKDLQNVPAITKENYLRRYPLEELCFGGALGEPSVYSATSGSTGEPFYFPRNAKLEEKTTAYHELFMRNVGISPSRSTLVVVGFGMGIWIGGLVTYQAFKNLTRKGYRTSIITPGVNKKEIYAALKNIGPKFDEIILCGYPPFLKDVVDEGRSNGIHWSDYRLKLIFAAEGFSEKFRDYVARKAHIKNPIRDTTNIYGTADLGAMAIETPTSVLIRRLALADKVLFREMFTDATRIPTLVQFDPTLINFEAANGELLCTGESSLPLVRYAIGDKGGVIEYGEMKRILAGRKIKLESALLKAGISDTGSELPFVYLYERADFSTKLYGAIIFPSHIREALENHSPERYLTGRFTMYTNFTGNQNEYLELNLELKSGAKESEILRRLVSHTVIDNLQHRSAEYKYLYTMIEDKVIPQIIFWPHEHPKYFKVGIKQQWVRKAKT